MEANPYARIRNKRPEAAVKFLPTLPETRAKPSWLQAKPAFKELSPVRPGTQVSTLDTGYKNLYYTGFKTCYTGYRNYIIPVIRTYSIPMTSSRPVNLDLFLF